MYGRKGKNQGTVSPVRRAMALSYLNTSSPCKLTVNAIMHTASPAQTTSNINASDKPDKHQQGGFCFVLLRLDYDFATIYDDIQHTGYSKDIASLSNRPCEEDGTDETTENTLFTVSFQMAYLFNLQLCLKFVAHNASKRCYSQ